MGLLAPSLAAGRISKVRNSRPSIRRAGTQCPTSVSASIYVSAFEVRVSASAGLRCRVRLATVSAAVHQPAEKEKEISCFSWLNPGQIVIHRKAFGPLQPAVVGILSDNRLFCWSSSSAVRCLCTVLHADAIHVLSVKFPDPAPSLTF
jgi:hypothetical protein